MQLRLAAFSMALILAFAPSVFAGGKKETKVSITFHLQAEDTDNPKMIFDQLTNGKRLFFKRLPEIGTKDVQSFNPFPSDFGDYGMVVKLKGNAASRFTALTNAYQQKWMISQVNGKVVDGFLIDKEVDDGLIVIWKGLSLVDINMLDEELPRIGHEGEKKKKKKK